MVLSEELTKSILGLVFLGLGWLFKTFYDNYFKIRPRLYISIPNVLSQQIFYNSNYRFTYTCEMTIKNNSEYTAENINFIFLKNRSISEIDSKKILKPNNHLKSYEPLQIETHKTVEVHADKVQVFFYEGNERIQTFNTQMQNPPEYFKPEYLKKIVFLLEYKSSKNKSFYTLYTKISDLEFHMLFRFKFIALAMLYFKR